VEGHELVGGGEVALLGVVHLVKVVDALGVVLQQPRGESERIPLAHLTVVGDVGLERERRHPLGLAMRPVEPHVVQPLIGGEIEDHQVIAHVQVAVVVDPLRPDDGAVDVERGRDLLWPQRGSLMHGGSQYISTPARVRGARARRRPTVVR
jgi:hypothetical protein